MGDVDVTFEEFEWMMHADEESDDDSDSVTAEGVDDNFQHAATANLGIGDAAMCGRPHIFQARKQGMHRAVRDKVDDGGDISDIPNVMHGSRQSRSARRAEEHGPFDQTQVLSDVQTSDVDEETEESESVDGDDVSSASVGSSERSDMSSPRNCLIS